MIPPAEVILKVQVGAPGVARLLWGLQGWAPRHVDGQARRRFRGAQGYLQHPIAAPPAEPVRRSVTWAGQPALDRGSILLAPPFAFLAHVVGAAAAEHVEEHLEDEPRPAPPPRRPPSSHRRLRVLVRPCRTLTRPVTGGRLPETRSRHTTACCINDYRDWACTKAVDDECISRQQQL